MVPKGINMKITGQKLVKWYQVHQRDLPWRRTRDPYLIWISEVILQQTRVAQGIGYYHRFISQFPDLQSLAAASQDEVLKAWQGLGYYSRARNLHEAALNVVKNMGGKIPGSYDRLLQMKGIGPYIAAAVASFAFDERIPVVDGNVVRVISRLTGICHVSRQNYQPILEKMMRNERPSLFNQAIMEFGAVQCIPGYPDCNACPFSKECYAYINNAINDLPVKKKKVTQRNRFFHYFIIKRENGIMMKKRDGSDIWKGLYDFPLIETSVPAGIKKLKLHASWKKLFGDQQISVIKTSRVIRHVLTHQVIHAKFYLVDGTNGHFRGDVNYVESGFKEILKVPVPQLIENFMKQTDWMKFCIFV